MKSELLKYNAHTLENIHNLYKEWIAELDFIFEEEQFFEDIINTHFIALCNLDLYNKSKDIVHQITINKTKLEILRIKIYTNKKRLTTQMETQNPAGESYFHDIHQELFNEFSDHLKTSKSIKSASYNLIKKILLKNKQKRIND